MLDLKSTCDVGPYRASVWLGCRLNIFLEFLEKNNHMRETSDEV